MVLKSIGFIMETGKPPIAERGSAATAVVVKTNALLV